MEEIKETVEIGLSKEELDLLYKTEALLFTMRDKIYKINALKVKTDKATIDKCLKYFVQIRERYDTKKAEEL